MFNNRAKSDNNVLMFDRAPLPEGAMVERSRDTIATDRDARRQLQVVEQIAAHVQRLRRRIEFGADAISGQILVVVMDGEGRGVIRRIRPEQALRSLKSVPAPV